uniref:Uncharacterized protein n=1 Tax=viral metagenome TaxID=1070528 RepID=A0A6C0K1W2_9ZZZZ
MSKIKEDVILYEVRRLYLRPRSYPKCFKTLSSAMEIYDFLRDQYPEVMNSAEVHHLSGLYTLLLCGLSALHNKKSTPDKILLRFSRYINAKGSVTWEFIQSMFIQMMNKDIDFFRTSFTKSPDDAEVFLRMHALFRDEILQQLGENLVTTVNA